MVVTVKKNLQLKSVLKLGCYSVAKVVNYQRSAVIPHHLKKKKKN